LYDYEAEGNVHPAGIKFGLSHDLLEFRGADVVVSDRFFERISAAARRRIDRNNRLTGLDLWDPVVSAGIRDVLQSFTDPHTEYVPFFTGLDRVIRTTLIPFAEKSKVGRRLGREFGLENLFWTEFDQRLKKLDLSRDMVQTRRLCFRACCNAVRFLCAQNDPANVRHADLLALCAYNILNSAGHLEITVFFRTAGPKN
jgi:hypothetical protein